MLIGLSASVVLLTLVSSVSTVFFVDAYPALNALIASFKAFAAIV
jgi:hypothetical protein